MVGGRLTLQALTTDEGNSGDPHWAFKEDGQPGMVPQVAGQCTTACPV